MKILALTRYGALGASSRLRFNQYLPFIRKNGVDIVVSSFFDDSYVIEMFASKVSYNSVIKSYMKRLNCLMTVRDYDIVWVEKEIFPWIPSMFEFAVLPATTRLVVDYDDALFHRYDEHRSSMVRKILGRKIDAVMRRADLVTAGNDYLIERARIAGSRRIEWLPTVVDLERYIVPKLKSNREEVVIGWIGSPSTASYLQLVSPALSALSKIHRIRCVAIGARQDQVIGTPFQAIPWDEKTEVRDLQGFDIGIMPLLDAPWERGKCGYKLIQYMACGLPVVASPVGVNADIIEPGENGYLASTLEEWIDTIGRLISDPALRESLGSYGRQKVENIYSLQVQAPRLSGLLHEVASGSIP